MKCEKEEMHTAIEKKKRIRITLLVDRISYIWYATIEKFGKKNKNKNKKVSVCL